MAIQSDIYKAAVQSKNAVCASVKLSRYFHETYNSLQSTPMLKGCIYTCFDIVDTAFSYERELIICTFLQNFSGKESNLQLILNAHTAFLPLWGRLDLVLKKHVYVIRVI